MNGVHVIWALAIQLGLTTRLALNSREWKWVARRRLARAGRRVISLVISLAFGQHFRVLACVAASPLLGRLLGFLSFTLSLGKGVLVLSRHALQVRLNSMTQGPGLPEAGYAINNSVPACSSRRNGWVRVSRQCGPLPLPAPTGPKQLLV